MSGVNISTHPEAGHAYNLEVGGSLSGPSGSIVFVFEFVFVLVFPFLFVFVYVFAIAATGTCQILIGGLCPPKGYLTGSQSHILILGQGRQQLNIQ